MLCFDSTVIYRLTATRAMLLKGDAFASPSRSSRWMLVSIVRQLGK